MDQMVNVLMIIVVINRTTLKTMHTKYKVKKNMFMRFKLIFTHVLLKGLNLWI